MPINNNLAQRKNFSWEPHFELSNRHAFMAPSKKAWLNYNPDRIREVWINDKAKEEGTRLHAYASEAIMLKQKQARSKRAVAQFINDAIGFGMDSEITLAYSLNCFGTCDAILFKDGLLRIHDLKTGKGKVYFDQLVIYAALFCLEYHADPEQMDFELRIYQGMEVMVYEPTAEEIIRTMDHIQVMDNVVNNVADDYALGK